MHLIRPPDWLLISYNPSNGGSVQIMVMYVHVHSMYLSSTQMSAILHEFIYFFTNLYKAVRLDLKA